MSGIRCSLRWGQGVSKQVLDRVSTARMLGRGLAFENARQRAYVGYAKGGSVGHVVVDAYLEYYKASFH